MKQARTSTIPCLQQSEHKLMAKEQGLNLVNTRLAENRINQNMVLYLADKRESLLQSYTFPQTCSQGLKQRITLGRPKHQRATTFLSP